MRALGSGLLVEMNGLLVGLAQESHLPVLAVIALLKTVLVVALLSELLKTKPVSNPVIFLLGAMQVFYVFVLYGNFVALRGIGLL